MEVRKYYKNMKTNEKVVQEDATDYAFEKLGIKKIEPMGNNGEYTLEQIDFMKEFTDWYFSGEWTEEEITIDEPSVSEIINESCYKDDMWRKEKEENG